MSVFPELYPYLQESCFLLKYLRTKQERTNNVSLRINGAESVVDAISETI